MAQYRQYFWTGVLVFLCTLLVFYQVRKSVVGTLMYDDGFNAAVAKNLANGFGYSIRYPVERAFTPDMTTGPLLILPLALAIKFLGARYWLPSVTAVMVMDLLLWLAFWNLRRVVPNRQQRAKMGAITVFLLLLFTSEGIGGDWDRPGYLRIWHQLLGEIPSFALVILAFEFALEKPTRLLNALVAGFCLGLAILTKSVTAFAAMAVLPGYFFSRKEEGLARKTWLEHLALGAMGLVFAPLLFHEVQHLNFPSEVAWSQHVEEHNVFLVDRSGSGIKALSEAPKLGKYLLTNGEKNFRYLSELWFGKQHLIGFLFFLFVIWFGFYFSKSRRLPIGYFGRALLATAFLHLTWWFFVSDFQWARHVLLGWAYGVAGVAVYASLLSTQKARLALVCALGLVCYPRFGQLKLLFNPSFAREPALVSLLEARARLETARLEKKTLLSFDYPGSRELEYLLSGADSFKECYRWAASAPPPGLTWLVLSDQEARQRKNVPPRFADHCAKSVFQSDQIRIYECSALPIIPLGLAIDAPYAVFPIYDGDVSALSKKLFVRLDRRKG